MVTAVLLDTCSMEIDMATQMQTEVTKVLEDLGFEMEPESDRPDRFGGTQYMIATDKAHSTIGPVLEGTAKLAVNSDGGITVVE